MRYSIILAIAILAACGQPGNKKPGEETTNDTEANLDPVKKDVTPQVAYNNQFLTAENVDAFIGTHELSAGEASDLKNFYRRRNFEFAWFSNIGVTEELRNFWNLYTYDVDSVKKSKSFKKLDGKLEDMLTDDDSITIAAADSNYTNLEFAITQRFIERFGNDNNVQERLLPAKKVSLTDFISHVNTEKNIEEPPSVLGRQYNLLKKKIQQVANTPKTKMADFPDSLFPVKKGMQSRAVPELRRMLLPGNTDKSPAYDDSLFAEVKRFQQSKGRKQDGLLTKALLETVNRENDSLAARIAVNMNRLLWLPKTLPDHYLLVNIPEFMLHAYENNEKMFDMEIVVGKEGTSTMMFTGNMNNIVFSPYWNLPTSIVKKEVLPGIEKNPKYLEEHHMEITGKHGDIPVVRQLPGEDNALGKVKFLFPNSFAIYLHDTNAKYLFERSKRAFSHGCIRLKDPEKMANYILRNSKEWTPEKINEAMNSKEEKWVRLQDEEPVIIAYLTVMAGEGNGLSVFEDIYNHDAMAISHLLALAP